MNTLNKQSCEPCKGGIPPLEAPEINDYLKQIDSDWINIKNHHIRKEFLFPNFIEALDFTNKVGEIAENEGHHPDIELSWGKVVVKIYTHKIDGLHKSDFILASKIDAI